MARQLLDPYAAPPAAATPEPTPGKRQLVDPYAATSPAEPTTIIPRATIDAAKQGIVETGKVGRRLLAREQAGVDYETGLPDASLTAKLSILSRPEQEKLLKGKYGSENIDTDAYGNWILKPSGFAQAGVKQKTLRGSAFEALPPEPIAILPKERWTLPRAAGHAGEVLPMAGGIAGSVAGATGGPLGGMAGAGLGTAAGEAGNALIAQALGIADRRPEEQAKALLKAGASGLVGEGVARGLMKIGRATAAPYAELSPLSPDVLETGKKAAEMGLAPRIGAANPKAFLAAREQGLIEAVFGFAPEKRNIDILRKEGQKLIEATGGDVTASQKQLIAATERRLGNMNLDFTAAKNKATQLVDDSIQNLQWRLGKSTPIEMQKDIEGAYRGFQGEASNLYAKADSFVGNKPVVPTLPVRNAAQGILDSLPKTAEGKPLYDPDGVAVQFLTNLTKTPELMSMQQMQALRSQLASSAEVRSLLASTGARNSEILRQSANEAFDSVGRALANTGRKRASAAGRAAIDALREADAFYSKGMQKFDLPIIRKMTLEARSTGSVAPEQVLDAIAMPNAATNVGRIMSLVKPETQQAIRRAHFDSMLEKAGDPITGNISGIKLAGEIKRLRSTFPALYGKDAKSIQTLANQLAAMDGKLDPALLKSGNIKRAIQQAVNAEKAAKQLTDDQLFGVLAKPGFESSQAVDHLFKPGSPERISRALKFFGENSKEAKNIRAIAMGKLFGQMEITEQTRNGTKNLLSGKALEDALKLYGRPTIDAMFGKEQSAALHEYARVAEMATAKNPHLSTIAGAMMVLNPVMHIKSLAELFTMGRIASSPGFVKWMTEGYRYPPPLARGTAAFTRAAAIAQAVKAEQPGVGGDTALDKEAAALARQYGIQPSASASASAPGYAAAMPASAMFAPILGAVQNVMRKRDDDTMPPKGAVQP